MKNTITTVIGDFKVNMSYQPAEEDTILNRFTAVINKFAMQPLIIVSESNPDLDTIMDANQLSAMALELFSKSDEAKIEKALYDSTRAGNGAGQRVTLSLSKREITLSRS